MATFATQVADYDKPPLWFQIVGQYTLHVQQREKEVGLGAR
ncbi:hypothetical protein [Actinomadura bangladeshensis]|nr:hypothetical protein [Actinomadura bangladeshensis]